MQINSFLDLCSGLFISFAGRTSKQYKSIIMKKILLLLAVFLTSAMLYSQTIQTFWEFGPTVYSPVLSFNGPPTESQIVAHVTVTNTGTSNIIVKVAREVIYQVPTTMHTFCWADQCYGPGTDTTSKADTIAPGEFNHSFTGDIAPNGTMGISTVKYTFFEVGNPANFSEVLINFNTLFSLSSESGDSVSMHTRQLNGDVDTPLHGMIKVHNYSDGPLNLISFKQPVNLIENSTNWFFFDGVEYAFGTDTSGLVTIMPTTTDESFEMFYDADGNVGISQIVYAFLDPTNAANYALYWVKFNAEVTGISDQILANTTFSPAYPNPSENFVSFDYEIPAEVNRAEIYITNLVGAIVYEGSLQGLNGTQRIDVSNLTGGIYFATLKLDNQIATSQKILVQ